MHISDRKKFTRRVKLPAIGLIFIGALYVGMFTDIYYGFYPVTGFVAMGILCLAVPIMDSIDLKEDI